MSTSVPQPTGTRGTERRVAVNSGLLLGAFGFQALISIVIVGLVARYLGQAGLGRYAYIISFIELSIVFADLGMSRIEVREISKDRAHTGHYSSAVFTLRIWLSLATMVVVGIVASNNGDPQLWAAVMVYLVAQLLFLLGDVFVSIFHGYQRMEYQFWPLNLNQVVLLVLTIVAIQLDLGLVALFGARLIANGLNLVIVWWIAERRYAKTRFFWAAIPVMLANLRRLISFSRAGQASRFADNVQTPQAPSRWEQARLTWQMLIDSLPVGMALILRSYVWRGGVVLTVIWLGQVQGDLANGILYGPLRVVQQMRVIPAAFAGAMLPVFSNRAVNRLDDFDTAFGKSIKLFAAISLLIALAFTFLADPIVALLLGNDINLVGAAAVLAVLGWVTVLVFPNWLYGVTLIALGRQKLEAIGLTLGLVVASIVAWWGIPRYGAMGVVFAILAAEGVYFVIGTAVMWKHFHWQRIGPSLLKIVLSCGLAGLVFAAGNLAWSRLVTADVASAGSLLLALELLVVGTLGLLVFVLALWVLRAFDADEIEAIRAMLQLKRSKS